MVCGWRVVPSQKTGGLKITHLVGVAICCILRKSRVTMLFRFFINYFWDKTTLVFTSLKIFFREAVVTVQFTVIQLIELLVFFRLNYELLAD